ncbi:hypothetical protein OG890_38935 [Streptomyces anulatus]|uniref:hypothetical protein n=1 Tax=Streptomyces anulatus TaxID=1892 RepID=UPI00225425D9|nr:hypothetical protein [Streptomyces anulatus]MCX4489865.1 hypothetical protein [Streptomyces anulatus]
MRTRTTDSPTRIRHVYDGHVGLYADILVTEAAALLDAYLTTAKKHGLDRSVADEQGWLALSAADAIARKYCRPAIELTHDKLTALATALRTAFTAEGMTVISSQIPMGVAVAPLPDGPGWGTGPGGWDDPGGLAVAFHSNSGWALTTNHTRRHVPVHPIYAPATEAGAAEVAQLVHGVLRGDTADPFRRNR